MKQYTRIYYKADGTPVHVHTQDTIILHEPVDAADCDYVRDVVVEHEGVSHLRAREIINSIQKDPEKVALSSSVVGGVRAIVRDVPANEKAQARKPDLPEKGAGTSK